MAELEATEEDVRLLIEATNDGRVTWDWDSEFPGMHFRCNVVEPVGFNVWVITFSDKSSCNLYGDLGRLVNEKVLAGLMTAIMRPAFLISWEEAVEKEKLRAELTRRDKFIEYLNR